jgi:putative FmdB family regulatory protein
MPTYEYQCDACDATFDIFQSIKASPLKKAECEACGGLQPVRRLIGTGGGIIFKGSGFYQTDYRSEGYKKAAKADSEKADSGKGDGGKGDKAASPGSGKGADSSTSASEQKNAASSGDSASKTSSE